MPEDHNLRLEELREACSRILDAAETLFGPEIHIGSSAPERADLYWTLGARAAYRFDAVPEPEVGSLYDDLAETRQMLARSDGTVYLWNDLDHVVGLLRRLVYLDLP